MTKDTFDWFAIFSVPILVVALLGLVLINQRSIKNMESTALENHQLIKQTLSIIVDHINREEAMWPKVK